MTQDREQELTARIRALELQVQDLEGRARRADSDNQAKSDFLAMISHEIRTPMNGVIGLSELLLETELAPRQQQFSKLILSSARSLLTLINSLLDFSKIEADKMHLEIRPFDLQALLEEVITLYGLSGKRKGITVALDLEFTPEPKYLGDEFRIRQVLVNLLGNAIKFTDQGKVVLSVVTDPSALEWIRFTVTDTGVGIAPDKQDRLFDPFSQADSSVTRRYRGTGLGLTISRKLIELMGGTMGFSSEPGKGSSFWFTLHLAQPDSAEIQQPTTAAIATDGQETAVEDKTRPARILIVDDDETNRMVLEEIFRKTEAEVSCAENGKQAVELCEQQFFDLILMDCRMPVMDGFTAAGHIREQQRLRGRAGSIIALTADGTRAAEKKCSEVGMDGYLLKPLDTLELQKVLNTILPDYKLNILPKRSSEGAREAEGRELQSAVDLDVLQELCQNIGDIKPVVTIFLRLLPRRLQELEQAVAELDSEKIQSIAHTLKGSCSQFGAVGLAELCAEAEHMAKENNLNVIRQQFDRISRTAEEVAAILTEQLD